MEDAQTRKVNPFLAFVAGFFGFGMGYVYVGRIRSAILLYVGFFVFITLLSWTRLVTNSASVWWVACFGIVCYVVFTVVHPAVLAVKNRHLSRKRYNRWWLYAIWIIAGNSLALCITNHRATAFGYEPFRVRSTSMAPTLNLDEFFMADTWRYLNHAPVVGEVVIVERPEDPGVKYVKRVVAVAGDSIEMRDGTLYRNGRAVAEPYVHAPMPFSGSPRNLPVQTLGPGLIYVLGDYRDNSLDSRQWGPFVTSSLRGRVQYIWFSVEGRRVRWGRIGTSLDPHN